MIKKISLLLLILLFSGCKFFTGQSKYFFTGTGYNVPDGTPIFQQGYKDGCENGIYSRGNTFYRTQYHSYQYTPALIDNPEYKFGYGRGYGYCFTMNTSGIHSAGGFDAFIYMRGVPFDMGRNDYNKTINYEQGTWSNPFNSGSGIDGVWGAVQNPKGFSAFGTHPLYGTPSSDQIFGW